MKKYFAILSMICLMPLCASAQWYLFPSQKENEVKEKDVYEKVIPRDSSIVSLREKSATRLTLILPIQAASEKPSDNFLEMYSGALLAVRDLGQEGINIEMRVIDSSDGKTQITPQDLDDSDIIIGPIAYNEIISALDMCKHDKYLISPLEPKAEALVGSSNVIQSPVPWSQQIDELVRWLKEDIQTEDKILLIKDSLSNDFGEQSEYLIGRLKTEGLDYSICNSLHGSNIDKAFNYRVLIASDKDSFTNSAVGNVGISSARFGNITLYSTAKVRNSLGNNVSDLHNAGARITAAYFINYDSDAVRNFIFAYRSLFKTEPSAFAFQGYDAVHYFVSMFNRYGNRWYDMLPEHSEKGLQSNFSFDYANRDGKINTAVHRIIYNKDFSTTVEQ